MIYEFPNQDEPIRQGDIFIGLPRVEVSLREISVVDNKGVTQKKWEDIVNQGEQINAIFPVKPVSAIVITQDCDNTHGRDITLCEIRDFREVYTHAKDTKKPKSWANILTQHARLNLKWFYLPPNERMGFEDKLAVDFTVTIRVPREGLENLRNLRKGRLNEVADEHFRERISEYFRRYPYDEWYALNKEELDAYQQKHPDAKSFPWQEFNEESQ